MGKEKVGAADGKREIREKERGNEKRTKHPIRMIKKANEGNERRRESPRMQIILQKRRAKTEKAIRKTLEITWQSQAHKKLPISKLTRR
jgi:hypothetical protein